jgi:hypothetical protein
LVLSKRHEEIQEWLGWNTETNDGVAQGNHHGVPWLAAITGKKLLPPGVDEVQRFRTAVGFVGQVVGPSTVSINGMKVRDESSGKEKRDDGEILIMRTCDMGAIGASFSQRGGP